MTGHETTQVERPQRDRELERSAAEARMRAGRNRMAIGGLLAVGGAIATLVSYSNAEPGDRYTLWWGAIIFGAISFIAGLADYMGGAKAKDRSLEYTAEPDEAPTDVVPPPPPAPAPRPGATPAAPTAAFVPPPPVPPPAAPTPPEPAGPEFVTPWIPSTAPRPAAAATPSPVTPWMPSAAPTRPRGRLPWVVLGLLIAVFVAVLVGVSLGRGDDSGDRARPAGDVETGDEGATDEGEVVEPSATTLGGDTATTTSSTVAPVADRFIETAIGPLEITAVRRTAIYPEDCGTDPQCLRSPSGERIVVFDLLAGGTVMEEMKEIFQGEFFASTIEDGSAEPAWATWVTYGTDSFEVAYAFLGSDDPASMTLYWPGNDPIALPTP